MTGHGTKHKRMTSGVEPVATGKKVDNSVSTLQKLFQLYTKSDLCDVQLQVGPHVFHAHRLILSMSSDVFKTMLTDTKWPDAHKARILLNEEQECVEVFGDFLQYMYTGNIHLSNVSVLPVLMLADKYNIYDLGNECRNYMVTHCHTSPSNLRVVSWLRYARMCDSRNLEAAVKRYIELNFEKVMQSRDFLSMPFELLEEMCQCEHLVIHSEYTLFVGLKKWLLHNDDTLDMACENDQMMERRVLQIMSNVRLPLMNQAQLSTLKADPFVNKYRLFFVPKTFGVCCFHASNMALSVADILPGGCDCDVDCQPGGAICHHLPLCTPQHAQGDNRTQVSSKLKTVSQTDAGGKSCSDQNVDSCQNSLRCRMMHVQSSFESTVWNPEPSGRRGQSSSTYYAPRNYMCDDWSACLTIENFPDFPPYASHTYFFSTPKGMSAVGQAALQMTAHDGRSGEDEGEDSSVFEWQVEMYPKGIMFPPAVMISIPRNHDIDEHCQDVVRVAIISKTHHSHPCRVDVSVLAVARGAEDGTEYVEALAHKRCIFDKERMMHNIDNIVPFHHLNCSRSKYLTSSNVMDAKKTDFKVVVIIRPS